MSERLIFVNGIPALYDALKKAGREEEGRNLIKSFLLSTFQEDMDQKVKCFLEIPGGLKPADMEYFRLYWELMQLYINGMFYSTVVLSGVLCERVCYDKLSRQELRIGKGKPLTKKQIESLFEMNLSKLIDLLQKWDVIKKSTQKEMHLIRKKRNEYVHPKKRRPHAKQDAFGMIKRVSRIIENEFPVRFMYIQSS